MHKQEQILIDKMVIRLDDLGQNCSEDKLVLLDDLFIENVIRILNPGLIYAEHQTIFNKIRPIILIDHSKISTGRDYFEAILNDIKK